MFYLLIINWVKFKFYSNKIYSTRFFLVIRNNHWFNIMFQYFYLYKNSYYFKRKHFLINGKEMICTDVKHFKSKL